jgi:predicted nucleic acid-binding protein
MIGADTTFLVQLEIQEAAEHVRAHEVLRREILGPDEKLALAPQVLTEFLHIVTEPRRFSRPLTMEQARDKARFWWAAREVQHVFPSEAAASLFLDWHARHQLGRKRLLDTMLGATLWAAGVRSVVSSNAGDFSTLGFDVITP